jgi:H+-transporting ATPase
VFKVSKGAPHVLLKLISSTCSDKHAMHELEEAVERDVVALGERGIRCLAVAKTDVATGVWQMMGLLTFLDPPRPDTKKVSI